MTPKTYVDKSYAVAQIAAAIRIPVREIINPKGLKPAGQPSRIGGVE